ncbi:MAG: hypothetical protein OXL96_07870 [Candidatus Poribacteria bacterium]|nr:hypothetical protein [Candidatus Poribacteria bacterium]
MKQSLDNAAYDWFMKMDPQSKSEIALLILDSAVLEVLVEVKGKWNQCLTQGQITRRLSIPVKVDTHPTAPYNLTVRESLFRLLEQGKVVKIGRKWKAA